MKFLILGDVHLGKGLSIGKPGAGKDLNSRIKDQLDLLNWVLKYSLKNDFSTIFVTGDVYNDPKPHPALINFFMSWLKTCEKSGVSVHVIAGNHDIMRTGNYTVSALDLIPSIEMEVTKLYKDVDSINFGDGSVTLIPYRDRRMYEVETTQEALEKLKKEIGKPNATGLKVAIGHLALEGSISIGDEIDDELNEIFCPPDMFSDFDYVWMGHVHKPQIVSDKNPYVAHVGSMERSDFSEAEMSENKIIIAFDSSKPKHFEEVTIPNRPIQKVEISVPKDKDSTEHVINALTVFDKTTPLKEAIIKLEIQLPSECLNVERDKITNFLYKDIGAHYICYFSESRILETIDTTKSSVIKTDMTPTATISAYWDSQSDLTDEERELCRTLALEVNKIYEGENDESI